MFARAVRTRNVFQYPVRLAIRFGAPVGKLTDGSAWRAGDAQATCLCVCYGKTRCAVVSTTGGPVTGNAQREVNKTPPLSPASLRYTSITCVCTPVVHLFAAGVILD